MSSRVVLVSGIAVAALAGCSSGDAQTASGSPAAGACGVEVADAWVKAAEKGMTAAFATLANPGQAEVIITGANSPAAGMVELHQTVQSDGAAVMQQMPDGLALPAAGSVTLAPGGDHLMLMQLAGPIAAGDEIDITLQCAAGSQEFTALAKTYTGAEEDYSPTPAAS